MSRFRTIAAAAAVLLVLQGAWADEEGIPLIVEVPESVVEPYHAALLKWREELAEERTTLKGWHDTHNQIEVPEGSKAEADLREEGKKLKAAIQRHAAASREFNKAVEEFGDMATVFARGLAGTNRGAPLNAPRTNSPAHRGAHDYASVIDQFRVETSARYEPGTDTYCNIFVWDVTRAMGAEIPHYVLENPAGASGVDELGKFTAPADLLKELKVNPTVAWLTKSGVYHGWKRVEAKAAQHMANDGHPTIAIWPNPDAQQPGHVAMVRPGSLPLGPEGPAIAQAGRLVLDADHLDTGFKDPALQRPVQYWYHE